MTVWNHKGKFVFLCEPHTASRATEKAIYQQMAGTSKLPRQHMPPSELESSLQGYAHVATVRNPFDVLVTLYHRPYNNRMTFRAFVQSKWDHRDTCTTFWYAVDCDHIIYYEHLESDLKRVLRFDLELGRDPKHSSAGKKPWHTYYDEETFERLKTRDDWKRYLDTFGYDVSLDGRVVIDSEIRERLSQPIPEWQ